MKRLSSWVPMVALIVGGTALPSLAQTPDAVRQASQKFEAAMSAGDAPTASGAFTDDAVVLPPGRQALKTHAEIQMFFTNMARNVQNLRYAAEDISPIGDAAVREVGSLSFTLRGGQNGKAGQEITGKYLIVWAKAGGDWKIAANMWNRIGVPQGGKGQGGRVRPGKSPSGDAQ